MKFELSPDDQAFYDDVRNWFETNTPERLKGEAFMFGTMSAEDNVEWCRTMNAQGWAAILGFGINLSPPVGGWPPEGRGPGGDRHVQPRAGALS